MHLRLCSVLWETSHPRVHPYRRFKSATECCATLRCCAGGGGAEVVQDPPVHVDTRLRDGVRLAHQAPKA